MMTQTDYTGGAAQVCNDYTNADTGTGVYSDWYVPSRDELNKLQVNRAAIGIVTNQYWSSSEWNASGAWYYSFGVSLLSRNWKSSPYRVRAVRSF